MSTKVIVITGASSGIGAALAGRLGGEDQPAFARYLGCVAKDMDSH